MYSNYQQEPDYPAALGLLSHLNAEELKELLNDDGKFEDMIKDVKQFKDMETEKEMIMASNRSLAEFNLGKEPQLLEGKQRVQEQSETGEALCRRIETKVAELKQNSGDMTLDTAMALLETAAAESEEESEVMAEKLLEGELELDSFLEQFLVRRKLMHMRRVKVDKMAEIMARQGPGGGTPHNTPSYFPLPPVSSPMPYPLGALNMPMPSHFAAPNAY